MKSRRTWVLVGMVLICGGSLFARELETQRGTQWFPYVEWRVGNPSWEGNAFDVQAFVDFTSPVTGEQRRTAMFYLGGENWAFRFTGTRVGEWSFVTTSTDEDLDGYRGRVSIEPNPHLGAHGFLKAFGNKWGWEGGKVFVPQLVMWDYIAGDNSPRLFHQNPELIDDKLAEFIAGHGFNGFHLPVVGGRWFDVDAASERVDTEMTEPDPRTFEALELLITKTHTAGGFVHLWAWGDHQRFQTPRSLKGGLQGVVDRRLQRYIAARLGPIPGWSMGYGFDLDEWVQASQVRQWRDAVHRHSGWQHFLGGRPAGPNRGIDHTKDAQWNRGLDYASYEHHRPTYEVYVAALQALPGVPVMSEDRFRVRKGGYPDKDYSGTLMRRGLYHSTLAGGAANIWGIHPDLSQGGVFPNREQIKTYAEFFHGQERFLSDAEPAEQVSAAHDTHVLMSQATKSLVVYCESATEVEVDLTGLGDAQPAIAVDACKPYAEVNLGWLQPAVQTIKFPTTSDWVVAVGDFIETTDGTVDAANAP